MSFPQNTQEKNPDAEGTTFAKKVLVYFSGVIIYYFLNVFVLFLLGMIFTFSLENIWQTAIYTTFLAILLLVFWEYSGKSKQENNIIPKNQHNPHIHNQLTVKSV